MTLAGIRLRLHPLTPLMLLLAASFSGGGTMIIALGALGVHEGAHLLTAIKLRTRLDEIELMPFGAAIRLQALWDTPATHMTLIALAGPLANVLAACLLTLCVYVYPASALIMKVPIEINLTLALFNLIPALPLDGGRALCALLTRRIGQARAVHMGVWAGRALGAVMLATVLYIFAHTGRVQLYLVFSAVYILASGERERRQSEGAIMRAMLLAEARGEAPNEACWIAARADDSVYATARMLKPGKTHLIAVLDASGELLCVLSQSSILGALTRDASAQLSTLTSLAWAEAPTRGSRAAARQE